MTDAPQTKPRSSFPALCLILSIFLFVFAGMLLCHCPGVFMLSALFAALAFWRGTPGIRIAAVLLVLAGGLGAVTSIIAERNMKARVIENRRKFQERQADLASGSKPPYFPHWRDPNLTLQERSRLANQRVPAGSTFADVKAILGEDGALHRYRGVQLDLTAGTNSPATTANRDFQQWQYEYQFPGGAVIVQFEDKTKLPQPETRVTAISYKTTLETQNTSQTTNGTPAK